jgi:hypothetical protein
MLKKLITNLPIIRQKLVIILYGLNNSTSLHPLVFIFIIYDFCAWITQGKDRWHAIVNAILNIKW